MRNLGKILCAVFIIFCLSGCHMGQDSQHVNRVVTGISIVHRVGDATSQRHYSDPKKMELFLNYLRLLRPYVPATEDPEELIADSYRITLHLSDGNEKTYHQWGSSYISVDYQPWLLISPEMGSGLGILFATIDSDS